MKTSIRRGILAILLFTATLALFLPVATAQESSNAASAAKIDRLTNGSGYSFIKKTDIVWYALVDRKSLKNFKLIVTTDKDLMVSFVTVATKPQFQVTVDFQRTLLNFNNSLDFVKVGLDRDGDIFVRCDSSVRVMDSQHFKEVLDQVAAAANEVYEGVKPFLISK